ncbi:unnamed protein product [Notodromas monacha]|uniref:Protein CNPPD1 n=1 Tax=Notodromas monacha TaxID=399045 RepID=A0A7R9GCF7_9CRUS|nr:unnamed protein product [Notodromas monacha]CAG0917390.1 unnamed protein product [Notodromas monacha]
MRCGGFPMLGIHAAIPDFVGMSPKFVEDRVEEQDLKPKERSYSKRSVFLNHTRLQRRLRKSLYYGKQPKTDRPSLPMTGILVNIFANCGVQDSLEKLDMDTCASIARDACIAPSAVVLAMIYMERLAKSNPEFMYSVPSSHLFLVTTMVASKFLFDVHDDEGVYNDEWAKSGRLELDQVNKLEISFLSALDWNLFVSKEKFEEVLLKVEKTIALSEGSERGWFSVSDLMTLGANSGFMSRFYDQVLQQVLSVFFVTMTTYFLAALTMAAAVVVGEEATRALANVLQPIPADNSILVTPELLTTSSSSSSVSVSDSPPPSLHLEEDEDAVVAIAEQLGTRLAMLHLRAAEKNFNSSSSRVLWPKGCDRGGGGPCLGWARKRVMTTTTATAKMWDFDVIDTEILPREIPQSTRILSS